MTYDMQAHRNADREWLLRLVVMPGWADYAEMRAKALEKEDPTLHAGLVDAVRAANPTRSAGTTTRRAR